MEQLALEPSAHQQQLAVGHLDGVPEALLLDLLFHMFPTEAQGLCELMPGAWLDGEKPICSQRKGQDFRLSVASAYPTAATTVVAAPRYANY